jgi:hypothetical protein
MLTQISKHGFKGLRSLIELDLKQNPLSDLNTHSFADLLSLPILTLSSHDMSTLPNCMFDGLAMLTILIWENLKLEKLQNNVFCGNNSIETIKILNTFIKYVYQETFVSSNLHKLNHFETTIRFLCCSLPSHIKCTIGLGKGSFMCSHILSSLSLTIGYWISSVIICTTNFFSLIFWLQQANKLWWFTYIFALNICDFTIGTCLAISVVYDEYYHRTYVAFDKDIWQNSQICNLLKVLSQLMYNMILYLATVNSIIQQLLTKYAIRRIIISTRTVVGIFCSGFILHLVICTLSVVAAPQIGTNSNDCLLVNVDSDPLRYSMLAVNTILLLIMVITNTNTSIFFTRRKSHSTRQRKTYKKIVLRLVCSSTLYCASWIMILHVYLLSEIDQQWRSSVTLMSLSLMSIGNPIMNTYISNKFMKTMLNALHYEK